MKEYVYKYVTGHVFNNGVLRNVWETKEFNTQKELFNFLVSEKESIIEQKKSVEKHCEGGISLIDQVNLTSKAAVYENDKEKGILKRTILTNTYWWMDSMSDVHLGRGAEGDTAIFSESIKNRAHKVYPIDQHNWSLDGKLGKTLQLYESPISWRNLGIGKTGMTEGLFADAQIERSKNESRYMDYLNDEIDQHSVGMQYIDIQLAVNDEEEYPKEFAVYQKYLPKIGNRQAVEAQGYFFAVGKAKLKEYSAVIAGANELTPVIQPSGGAGKSDPSGDSRKALRLALLDLSLKI